MNRRTFFSRIGSAVVGCYLALNIPTLKGVVNRVTKIVSFPNPEYSKAPYEAYFEPKTNIYGRTTWIAKVVKRGEEYNPNAWFPRDPFPFRFNTNPGQIVTRGDCVPWQRISIPPFISKEIEEEV